MSVSVLVCGGKTVSVPYSQTSAVSSVITQSLSKAKVNCEKDDNYALYYNNKKLDNSNTMRRSGIPQGASLILKKLNSKKKVQETKIALQLPTKPPKRLAATLPSNFTLWDVLVHFESEIGKNISSSLDEAYSYPAITFMNRNFASISDLQSNSIASLGANGGLFKLSFGNPSGKTPRDLGIVPEPQQSYEENPAQEQENLPKGEATENEVVSTREHEKPEKPTEEPTKQTEAINETARQVKLEPSSEDIMSDVPVDQPEAISEKDTPMETEKSEGDLEVAESQQQSVKETEVKEDVEMADSEPIKNIPTNDGVKPKEKKRGIHIPDRKLRYFAPSTGPVNIPKYDLPDEAYQLRPSDLKSLKNDKHQHLLPMDKEKFRASQEEKFKQVKIRIIFPDRQAIEAFFGVKEKVKAIHDLIVDSLDNSKLTFILFVTPPKTVLPLDSTLFSQKLYPAARIYVEWTKCEPPKKLFRSNLEFVPDSEFQKKVDTSEPANPPTVQKKSKPSAAAQPKQSSKPTDNSKKKSTGVPKWFLAGKK